MYLRNLLDWRSLLDWGRWLICTKAIEKKFCILSITCLERYFKPSVAYEVYVCGLCHSNLVVVSVPEIGSSVFIDVVPGISHDACIGWRGSCFDKLRIFTKEHQVLIVHCTYFLPFLYKHTIR